jgi:ABC-2 type transport system ATP-binding protein
MIKTKGLTKTFGSKTVLGPISLELKDRGIVGLIGPDGAGKTTLLRILCGIMDPGGGEIEMEGIDIKTRPEKVKDRIGYMPQRFSLYGDLTVMENMQFYGELYMVPGQKLKVTIERLLKFSGLTPFVGRRAENLSGGMKQKLGLSCALIHKPEVLMLDEPTNGVDPLSRLEFWQILKELKEEGVFIIVSTPYMDEAEKCDNIILIDGGKLLHYGTPGELKARHLGLTLDIATSVNSRAAAILEESSGILSVNDYGQSLHINCASGMAEDSIRQLLDGSSIRVIELKKAEPGIEDAFIYMVNT